MVFGEKIKFWQINQTYKIELLSATYISHCFSRHWHEEYAIGIIEDGALAVDWRGSSQIAPASTIAVVNPGEIHNGHSALEAGFTYRMMYIEPNLLRQISEELTGKSKGTPYFVDFNIKDQRTANRLLKLHKCLESSTTVLQRDSLTLTTFSHLISNHSEQKPQFPKIGNEHRAVKQVKEYLIEHFTENVSLDEITGLTNLSKFHLLRVFCAQVGLPPHAYVEQLRVEYAKKLLQMGMPAVRAAVEAGFFDQSHLTKHFKRRFGITPALYQNHSNFVQDNSL